MKKLLLGLLAAGASLALFCIGFTHDNPIDPDYQGDYRLSVELPDGATTLTAEVLRPINLAYATGGDEFSGISLALPAPVDTALFRSKLGADSLCFYFTAAFSGELTVEGIRPNLKTVPARIACEVTIPYTISGDTLLGVDDSASYRIVRRDAEAWFPESLQIAWSAGAQPPETLALATPFTATASGQAGSRIIRAVLIDNYGNSLALDSLVVRVPGSRPQIDTVYVPRVISLGDTLRLSVQLAETSNDSLTVYLFSDNQRFVEGSLLAVDSGMLQIRAPKPVSDTGAISLHLLLQADNRLWSDTFTTAVNVGYTLARPRFPADSIEVPLNVAQTVRAHDSTAQAVRYHWRVASLKLDTDTTSDSLSITYADSTRDTIIVRGIDAFGYTGSADTLFVKALALDYSLTLAAPGATPAGYWAVCVAELHSKEPLTASDSVVYTWQYEPTDSVQERGDTLRLFSRTPTSRSVGVKARVNGTFETNTVFRQVVFSDHRPVVHFTAPAYAALINQALSCSLSAVDPNGAIGRIYWQLDSGAVDSSAASAPVWQHTFSLPGAHTLAAWAVDNDGFVSDTDVVPIVVSSNAPVIEAVTVAQTLYYKKNATFWIQAQSAAAGGAITKYYWDFDGDTTTRWDTATVKDSLVHRFTDSTKSNVVLLVKCEDQFGRFSAPFSKSFPLSIGRPSVKSVSPDTVFINDEATFTIAAQDNELVARYVHSLDGVSFSAASSAPTFKAAFTDTGWNHIFVKVTDNDSLQSAVYRDSVWVSPGRPLIQALSLLSPADSVYVNDTLKCLVAATDANGAVRKLLLRWQVDPLLLDSSLVDGPAVSDTFSHYFGPADSGSWSLAAWAVDEDGVASVLKTTSVTVKSGKPLVDSIRITSAGSDFFVNDTVTCHVRAHDPNETIAKVYVSWSGSSVADDSLVIPAGQALVDTFFTHVFDTTAADTQALRFWVRDSDGFISLPADAGVRVRLAAPVLSGDSGDTLWVVVDSGYSSPHRYFAKVNSLDTNGVDSLPVKWFWSSSPGIAGATVTSTDSLEFTIDNSNINDATRLYIYAMDDDSLLRGGKFTVYPDSAPPAPVNVLPLSTYNVTDGDSVVLEWVNEDVKDGTSTEFAVEITLPGDPSYIQRFSYEPGTMYAPQLVEGKYHYYFKYKPTFSTTRKITWRVYSRDKRQTVSVGVKSEFGYDKPAR